MFSIFLGWKNGLRVTELPQLPRIFIYFTSKIAEVTIVTKIMRRFFLKRDIYWHVSSHVYKIQNGWVFYWSVDHVLSEIFCLVWSGMIYTENVGCHTHGETDVTLTVQTFAFRFPINLVNTNLMRKRVDVIQCSKCLPEIRDCKVHLLLQRRRKAALNRTLLTKDQATI